MKCFDMFKLPSAVQGLKADGRILQYLRVVEIIASIWLLGRKTLKTGQVVGVLYFLDVTA